jgi:hypothetical protein
MTKPFLFFGGDMIYNFFGIRFEIIKNSNNDHVFVYLLYDKYFRRYKIGITKNLKKRIQSIARAAGTEIEIIDYFEGWKINEKLIHKHLKQFNLKGEWYKDCQEILNEFELCKFCVLTGYHASNEIRKVPDERFGKVGSYSISILNELFEM